jgi:uncharacterized protein (DUF3084 family)
MSVKVDFKLTVTEAVEIRHLLESRKTQLETWILASHTSEEEREKCHQELEIVQSLRRIFE